MAGVSLCAETSLKAAVQMKLLEFFEGENKQLSMGRLLQFLAYPPATGVMIWIHTTEAMSLYISAFVLNGIAGKALDVKGRKNVAKSVIK